MALTPARDDTEITALGDILAETFAFDKGDTGSWLDQAGREHLRVVRCSGEVVGGLLLSPMAQFFGGRSLPMVGVGAVGVRPDLRGGGIATSMLGDAVRELHEREVPISVLYPTTQSLYRRVGYEQAGERFSIRLRPKEIALRDRDLDLWKMKDSDHEQARALYRRFAAWHPGHLDRCSYTWSRVLDAPRSPRADGYAVGRAGKMEGYAYLRRTRVDEIWFKLDVRDVAATTAAAARRLLTLMADHATVAESAVFAGGPAHPMILALPEPCFETSTAYWMLRLTHLKKALETRPFPRQIAGELDLEIEDPLLPAQQGRFRLSVESGRGRLMPGGDGLLSIHVRGLAALFTGHRSAEQIRIGGLCDGPEETLALATALFAGPAPSMPDIF